MLLDRGMQANTNIATRAIGYRQALDFLQVGVCCLEQAVLGEIKV